MIEYNIDFSKYFMFDGKGHGNGLIIKGGVGTAKTTMLSMIIKILLENTNFVFPTNIRFEQWVYDKYPDRLHFISNVKQYFEFYCRISYEQPLLLIWDDSQGNEGFKSTGINTSDGNILSSFLIYLRKFSTSYIYIAHQSYIPRSITEGFAPYFLYKIDKEHFAISTNYYEIDSDAFNDSENIIGKMLPYNQFDKYYLPILSHAFTDFIFNIDWFELKQFLSQYEVGEQLKEYMKIYLDNLENCETGIKAKYDILKKYSYQDLYIALCMKRGKILPHAMPLNEIINDNTITRAKKKINKEKLLT